MYELWKRVENGGNDKCAQSWKLKLEKPFRLQIYLIENHKLP